MKNKLTINLDKTEQGYNGVTKQPYLWTIIDEGGKDMYEVQIIKLNFPSTRKDIRENKNTPDMRKVMKALSHSGQRVSEYYGKNAVQ